MDPDLDNRPANIASALAEVSDRAQLLIREEIELAKTEVTEKISQLIKGAVVGLAAGIFIVTGLLFLLNGAAWAWFDFVFDDVSFGYFIVAFVLFALGGLAGYLASRAFKSGAPPVPSMAIDEAKKIKQTVDDARSEDHATVVST